MKTTPMLTAVLALIAGAPVLAQSYDVETLAEGLDRPWAMTFLPDSGDILRRDGAGSFCFMMRPAARSPHLTVRPMSARRVRAGCWMSRLPPISPIAT